MIAVDAERLPWERILPGVEAVRQRCDANWTAADVYLALKNKQAFLYMLDDGFLILQRLIDNTGPYLFVWVVYGKLARERHTIMAALRQLAVAHGCRRLEMRSPRKWEAADLGWRPKETVYVADLWD